VHLLPCAFIVNILGKAVDMSVDHKPTDEVELNRIVNAGGRVGRNERVNGGLNLSRAIGTLQLNRKVQHAYMYMNKYDNSFFYTYQFYKETLNGFEWKFLKSPALV